MVIYHKAHSHDYAACSRIGIESDIALPNISKEYIEEMKKMGIKKVVTLAIAAILVVSGMLISPLGAMRVHASTTIDVYDLVKGQIYSDLEVGGGGGGTTYFTRCDENGNILGNDHNSIGFTLCYVGGPGSKYYGETSKRYLLYEK